MARTLPSPSLSQACAILPCVVRSITLLQHKVATLYTWDFGRQNFPSWSQACCDLFLFDSMQARFRNAGKVEPYSPRGSRPWGVLWVSCSAADGTFFFLALKIKKKHNFACTVYRSSFLMCTYIHIYLNIHVSLKVGVAMQVYALGSSATTDIQRDTHIIKPTLFCLFYSPISRFVVTHAYIDILRPYMKRSCCPT